MMEPDHCTTSTSTECADGLTSVKVEPDDDDGLTSVKVEPDNDDGLTSVKVEPDDGPQSDEQLSYQHFKNDGPIINIAPVVTSGDCASNSDDDYLTVKSEPEKELLTVKSEPEEELLTVKSEPDDNDNSTETSIQTAEKIEDVTNIIPNLYEVKNESPCSTHTKIVYNNIDADSELVEVPGELDCKPEIIDNVNNVGVLGDVNMQTSVQHNDTVNHEPLLTSMNNCEVDSKETTLGK